MFLALLAASGCVRRDPHLWLEDIDGERALNWARAQNERTMKALSEDPLHDTFLKTAEALLQDRDRIPTGVLRSGYVYNFWQDPDHVRGLWRRAELDSYLSDSPRWQTLLDIDRLAEAEKENFVFRGVHCLKPGSKRCLVELSRGGGDASVMREFDIPSKTFVSSGFFLPEAKSTVTWIDIDTVAVGTDFGPGSLTTSGYPRLVKIWKRGQPLSDANTLFEGGSDDVSVSFLRFARNDGEIRLVVRSKTFFESEKFLVDPGFGLKRLDLPEDCSVVEAFRGRILLLLRSPWPKGLFGLDGAPEGALVAFDAATQSASAALETEPRSSVTGVGAGRDAVFVNLLRNVRGAVLSLTLDHEGIWLGREIDAPADSTINILPPDPYDDALFFLSQSFLDPSKLHFLSRPSKAPREVKRLPAKFDASGLVVEQNEAVSADGTLVPYFVVRRADTSGVSPTLLYGYGGFEVPLLPSYMSVTGKLWLERGGVYVSANIRGGGEFGPSWHQAALKEKRTKAFEDFIAVAEDLTSRKITSPKMLGIMGGSNGGLLVGAAMTMRPELFGAVVCQAPLLDMLRYTKLLAGASWAAEYGDPKDPGILKAMKGYSPYQNLRSGRRYPSVLFMTSTRDDRVHPGHARKMAMRMEEMGHETLYYENMEGGHSMAANLRQQAKLAALRFVFLWRKLT